eukprot:XP_014790417.1 PREDICTED: uncharacterized protein LOC106883796 isoform X1 [Octopus bimaculoides]
MTIFNATTTNTSTNITKHCVLTEILQFIADLLKFSLVSVLYSWFCSGSHVTCSRLEAGRCCLNPRQDLEDWTPILNWKTIQNKLPWGIVLVMGGGFAIADVSRVSTGFLINVVCVLTLTLAVHS